MGPLTHPDYWYSWIREKSSGRHEEAWRGVMCLLRWLAIREENHIPPPGRMDRLEEDVSHSRLLRRLIEGKEPLDAPPPPDEAGDPWYELVETGRGRAAAVGEVTWGHGRHLVIDRGVWEVVGRTDEGDRLVRYGRRPEVYRLRPDPAGGWSLART